MSLADLLKKREIEKARPDEAMARKLLAAAQNGLRAAEDNLRIRHPEVALTLAYQSMLNAGRALMAHMGYRAFSESHHKSVVSFCAEVLPTASSTLVRAFNRYRVRRHDIVYGEIEENSVGEDEAKEAIAQARELVGMVEKRMG